MKKPVDFQNIAFINLVNEAFVESLIIPEEPKNCKQVIKEAVKAFSSDKPSTVKKWSEKVCIDERYFRKAWVDCYGYPPRYFLWLYKILTNIFAFYSFLYCKEMSLKQDENSEFSPDTFEYILNKFNDFYHSRRDIVDQIFKLS